MRKRVEIVVDRKLAPDEVAVGGVRIVHPRNDEELGRELRTMKIACHPSSLEQTQEMVRRYKDLELV